jgi:hypothetical protein
MKKALKILGVLLVVAVVLLGLSSAALHFLLPPEKAKALVLKQLTAHLKREVSMGKVSVGIFSGLSVTDLKVSESPDFSKGTFISSNLFSIRLALWPLLFRKLELKQLVLDRPVIQVIRYADGKTFNFSDLMVREAPPEQAVPVKTSWNPFLLPEAHAAPAAPAVPAASETEAPFRLLISHAQIQEGVIRFIDKSPAKQSVDIEALNLKLSNVSTTSPFSVQASLTARVRSLTAALKLAGEADLATGSFKIKNCSVSSGGSTLTLSGKASQLKSDRPSVDLQLDAKQFNPAALAPLLALPPALKIQGPILAAAKLKGDQAKMDYAAQVDLENVQIIYGKQFSKPAHTPMNITARGDLTNLQNLGIADLKLILSSLQLKGHGKVLAVNSAQPQISMHIESNAFSAGDILALMPGALPGDLRLKGHTQFSADVSGTQASSHLAAKWEGKDLDIAFADKFKKPSGVPFRVSMVGENVQKTLTFQTLTAAMGSVELNGSGSVQTGVEPPRFKLSMKSNTFSLQDLSTLVPLLTEYRLGGTGSVDVKASGTAGAPLANGSMTLWDASLRYQQSVLSNVSTALTFTHQDVSIPKLTGKLNGSDLSLKLTGRRMTTRPDIHVDASIGELDLAKLLAAPAAPPPQTSRLKWVSEAWAVPAPSAASPMDVGGHLVIGRIKHEFYDARDMDVRWNLTDVTPDLSRVSGTTVFKQGGGLLKDVEKLAELSKSARMALLPLVTLQKLEKKGVLKAIKVPSLQKIPFEGIRGDYAAANGTVNVKLFELIGKDLGLDSKGTIGLAGAQPLDLRVVMKLGAGSLGGDLGALTKDASGRPTLPFFVRGNLADPKITMDLQDIGRKAVQKYGGDLLKGLGLGGRQPQQAPAPAENTSNAAPAGEGSSGSEPPPPPSVEDLQKALKNIFK